MIQEESATPSPVINIRQRQHRVNTGYIAITGKTWMSSLQLSFCQTAAVFGESAGKQCTAISAVATVYAAVKPPNEWTVQDGDRILTEGDFYDNQCRKKLVAGIRIQILYLSLSLSMIYMYHPTARVITEEHQRPVIPDHLAVDEILGEVRNCYGNIVRIELVEGGTVIYGGFDKFLREAQTITTNSVADALSQFLHGQSNYGLITAGKFVRRNLN